jgi:hypothetical protein
MSNEELEDIKAEVQKILDKHLEEDQRFSIKDFDEESTFLLIDLLLEKDDLKRKKIWDKIKKKVSICEMNIKLTYESVMEINDKLRLQKNEISNLDDLKNTVESDKNLEEKIENI